MAGQLDLAIIRGDTFNPTFTWMNESETPYNITGWTAKIQFRDYPDGSVIHEFDNSYFTINGSAGEITFTIPATETAAFSWSILHYDLQLTNPAATPNYVKTLLVGTVRCAKDITQ